MNDAARLLAGLAACIWLQSTCAGSALTGAHEECIAEPVFEGRVCTVQANSEARVGVLLIHGLNGSADDWRRTIPALAANFHVVAFDLPGFGRSDKGSQNYSPTRYASLVQFLADHYLQHKAYHVVGHSMGGAIALRYAAQQPLRFQRLVLIDAAGILHPQVITKFQAGSMIEHASGVPQSRGFAERLFGKLLEQLERLPISPIDIANSALGRDLVLQGGPEKIAALELAGEDFSQAIASVAAPTMILWGDNDPVAPLRTGKVLAARMQHSRLEIISGSGHEPMQDQTGHLNSLLRKYLLAPDDALAEYYKQAIPLSALVSAREATCSGESGRIFEGDYRVIELRDCSNITLRKVRVRQLRALNSRLTLIDTNIIGKDVGLQADNSDITITNGKISGVIAISAVDSRLDLAGVQLQGSRAACHGVNSKLVFSVSQISSPYSTGYLHGYKNMVDESF